MSYAVYTTRSGPAYIEQVNRFLTQNKAEGFAASTILVAQWIDVCSYYANTCSEVISYFYDCLLILFLRVTHFKV